MALEFDDAHNFANSGRNNNRDDEDIEGDAMILLKRLYLEERELYTKIAMLAKQQLEMNQRQSQTQEGSIGMSMNTNNLKQKALVDYVSNGENVTDFRVPWLIYLFLSLTAYNVLLLFNYKIHTAQLHRHSFHSKNIFDTDPWIQYVYHLWKMPYENFARLPKRIEHCTTIADNNYCERSSSTTQQ
jgi:hypothetical protein